MENPLKNVWKYEYDTKGDRTAESDPLDGNKRTWEYNEDSQEIATGQSARERAKKANQQNSRPKLNATRKAVR